MPATLVQSDQRPVPLEFEYSTTQLQEKVAELDEQGRSPVYLVHLTQNACADTARDLLSTNFCTKEEKHAIARALDDDDADFRSPYGRELSKILRHRVGIHHADFPLSPLLYTYDSASLALCLPSDCIPISRADSNVWPRKPDGPRHFMPAKQSSSTWKTWRTPIWLPGAWKVRRKSTQPRK